MIIHRSGPEGQSVESFVWVHLPGQVIRLRVEGFFKGDKPWELSSGDVSITIYDPTKTRMDQWETKKFYGVHLDGPQGLALVQAFLDDMHNAGPLLDWLFQEKGLLDNRLTRRPWDHKYVCTD